MRIGANCTVGASAVIEGWTEGGDDTEIYPFASIGLAPQDLKYKGEPSQTRIGNRNKIREFVTIHRGTENVSEFKRPVLVLGVDGPEATNAEHHDLAVTKGYWETLPDTVKAHLRCPIVDELTPITQKHDIEGLVMGEA